MTDAASRSYILYDERAFIQGTDEATVLVACDSDAEAHSYQGEYGAMCCYSYALVEGVLDDERWEWNCD